MDAPFPQRVLVLVGKVLQVAPRRLRRPPPRPPLRVHNPFGTRSEWGGLTKVYLFVCFLIFCGNNRLSCETCPPPHPPART